MRKEIEELKKLGRMPNESINDNESVDAIVDSYDLLLNALILPITYQEGEVLVKLFPENAFYDLQWSLLTLIESLIKNLDEDRYLNLINQCPSTEWRMALINRFNNLKQKKVRCK